MTGRSWRWLRTRIEGLLNRPATFDALGRPRFTTRIQSELWRPTADAAVDRESEAE